MQNIFQALNHAGKIYAYFSGLSIGDLVKIGAIKVDNQQKTVNGLLETGLETVVTPDGPYVVNRIKWIHIKEKVCSGEGVSIV